MTAWKVPMTCSSVKLVESILKTTIESFWKWSYKQRANEEASIQDLQKFGKRRVSGIWTDHSPFPTSQLSGRDSCSLNRRYPSLQLGGGFSSQEYQDTSISHPASSYLLLRLSSRWVQPTGRCMCVCGGGGGVGCPVFYSVLNHEKKALPWVQHPENTWTPLHQLERAVPCQER